MFVTDGLIWVAGSTFESNYAVGSGGAVLLDPTCTTQVSSSRVRTVHMQLPTRSPATQLVAACVHLPLRC